MYSRTTEPLFDDFLSDKINPGEVFKDMNGQIILDELIELKGQKSDSHKDGSHGAG